MRNKDDNQFLLTEEKDKSSETTCYFTVKGRVDSINASFMQQQLEKALQRGYKNIVINMCRVMFFSSVGIRAVLSIHKKAVEEGGRLQIDNPAENVKNVLGMTALDELLLRK